MSIPHAQPGEVVNGKPLGSSLVTTPTRTLLKGSTIELIRLVIPAGKELPMHKAKGEIIVQCLEGQVAFTALGKSQALEAGQLLFLPALEPHSVKGIADASLLLTVLLPR